MKKFFFVIFAWPLISLSQIPTGYYTNAQGLSGQNLLIALHGIIDNHTTVSYSGLWNAFSNTDKKLNGKVWDVYSDIPSGTPPYSFTFSSDQCGSYSVEGDCYNREHTWPQSWFSSLAGPGSDLFHVYPTDGKVNGLRDNYPYGNVGNIVYNQTLNGSKLGISTDLGYNSVVFQPIDEYKGDLARNYFYMSTRYYSEDNSWMTSNATIKSTIKPWELNVLLQWHHDDPVSSKEIDRNNKIYYSYQNNRNPFIDNPEWADSIWGETVNNFVSSVSLIENFENSRIQIYPNPSKDFFVISNLSEGAEIEIFDALGRIVNSGKEVFENELIINCENWEQGVYFISEKNSSVKKTFIKL
jgi:endonuclease I